MKEGAIARATLKAEKGQYTVTVDPELGLEDSNVKLPLTFKQLNSAAKQSYDLSFDYLKFK